MTRSSACLSSSPRRTATKMVPATASATSTTSEKATISLVWRLKRMLPGEVMLPARTGLTRQAVTGAPHGFDAQLAGLERVAQAGDVNIDRAQRVERRTPDKIEELLAAEDDVREAQE